jgi:pimeloyl-ACP methyl ester carboxylesterase
MDTMTASNNWVDETFPLRQIDVGEGVISFREHGSVDDPVIVLLHGIGSASGSWAYQLRDFSDRYRVIAWDAPGYGTSTVLPMMAPNAADYAAALVDFLECLSVQPDILIGHSLGALMVGAYAAKGGSIGSALILADPANGYGAADETVRAEKLSARLANIDKLGSQGLADARASALLSADASAEALEMVRWNMSKLRIDGHAQAAHMLAGGNLIGDAANYVGPVLVVCGSADTITPEEGCRRVSEAFPHADYHTLPDVGHASYVENPAQFNQAVIDFVEDSNA